jgi:hypothetical protein
VILPGKYLREDRALIGIGADILASLDRGTTVSELWEAVRLRRSGDHAPVSFDWFVLSLSFLYALSAVTISDGMIVRAEQK